MSERAGENPRELMPTKRLPHLLGFLASFKNHSSSRHNPTQPLSHQKRRKRYGRERERQSGREGETTTHRHWHKLCQKRLALSLEAAARSVEGKRRRILGPFTAGAGGGGRPTSKTFVWYPLHFYVFAQSSHLPHTHFTCLAASAETLTPNEKRQQIIHHFAFRLGSISSGKSYATQLGYCSSWRWPPPAPIVPFPTPEHSPVGVGGKNIIWNGLSSILCAIFLLFPFLFIFFSSTFFFACLRFAFSLLYPRRPRLF